MNDRNRFLLKLIITCGLFFPVALNGYAQKTSVKRCYFKNHQSSEYYLKIVEEYKTKQDLYCFVNMIDSLLLWSEKDSMEKKIRIFDAILNKTDGSFTEQGNKIIEFLSELYFGDLVRYMMVNKSAFIKRYFVDYYGRNIYDSDDHDARRDKFYATFDEKIEKSKLSDKEKVNAKAFIHSLKFVSQ